MNIVTTLTAIFLVALTPLLTLLSPSLLLYSLTLSFLLLLFSSFYSFLLLALPSYLS